MINFEHFRPSPETQELVLDVNSPLMAEPVAHVNDHLNRLGAKHFVEQANEVDTDTDSGTQYAIVGQKGFSTEELILLPGRFGNGVWSHTIAGAEGIHEMAKQAGVRDSYGNPLPVLVVAAPCATSSFGLSRKERSEVNGGNYDSIAERHLRIVDSLGYGALRGVYYSQAAAIASAVSGAARGHFDVKRAVVGEAPLNRLGFFREASGFEEERKKDDIDVIEELFETKQAVSDLEKGIVKEWRDNLAVIRGFAKMNLSVDLISVAQDSEAVMFLHAANSKVTPLSKALQEYNYARGFLRGFNYPKAKLSRVQVNSNHSFGDRVGSWSTVVGANLATAA
jgi:hypothetical protein